MSEDGTTPAADGGTTPAPGGETPPAGTPTDDGTGGKASMLSDPKPAADGEGDGGSKQLDIKSLLGDELAGNQNISKFLETENPVQELAKSLVEAQSQIGKPKTGVPGEQATAEEKAAFYKELGVPDDGAGYEFSKPEGMPDELYDEKDAAEWADFFKEQNLTKDQANAARDRFIQMQMQQQEAHTAALNESMDKAFGDKKAEITAEVGALMKEAVPDAELRAQIEAGIGDKNTPAFALALGHAIQHMKKTYGMADKNIGDGGDGQGGKSIDELRADAQKVMASEAYRDPMHRDHSSVKKQVNDMYKTIGALTAQPKK